MSYCLSPGIAPWWRLVSQSVSISLRFLFASAALLEAKPSKSVQREKCTPGVTEPQGTSFSEHLLLLVRHLLLIANLVTTSKAPVTTSVALVTTSFLSFHVHLSPFLSWWHVSSSKTNSFGSGRSFEATEVVASSWRSSADSLNVVAAVETSSPPPRKDEPNWSENRLLPP